MDVKSYIFASNRGPHFYANGLSHFAAGGTQDVYKLICKELAKKWICIAPDKYESDTVISDYKELDVLFVNKTTYNNYYYRYVSEYLYPNILGSKGLKSAAGAQKEFKEVSRAIAHKIGNHKSIILCDYHLYKVPEYIIDSEQIHFFWFLPFLKAPKDNQIYRDITYGLMKVDTLWFLHEDYKKNFIEFAEAMYGPNNLPTIETLTLGPSAFFSKNHRVDINEFKHLILKEFRVQYSPQCSYLITVARLDFVKKIPLLLQAMSIIENDRKLNIKLMILAPHHRQNSSFYQAEELKILKHLDQLKRNDQVFFSHNTLNREELIVLYKFTNLFILPSSNDAMPLTPLEYILANDGNGAVVVSDSAGTSKIMPNTTYIFKHDNPLSLANKIIEALLANSEDRASWMKQNKQITYRITSNKWINKIMETLKLFEEKII
ncbi:trehalose-6-phosphate synthase [Fulvivirga sediminis]|uniref:Trehalose-6-phosphate synthase n=1 Tax=Fulvivirga sediminis TaxID=2803949 RepID=A0A937FC94_9BACT|nr:trehalose-6-phosphate synthase [Fulvivirga sediminis]MBL3659047.1 trehalose-6-phosphate synthase [Fulvivirga sediminis]